MKHAFLAAALMTGTALATAPAAHAQGVRVGLKAGANYSNIAGDVTDEDRFENKFGFHGGLLLNADLTGDGFFSPFSPSCCTRRRAIRTATRSLPSARTR
ncbi:hypothetical protein [Hymenobacter jeollabukensis]|uniref:PorT family protein n=1 Tax=Hymenobacter jeollabukensis TaxID=2025313 RepID=A0A5R8WV37_9BACT|nr:hypothetical protein [Hymenobacter jeollabukensis]TLM95577.1 hypothetical protein FDY95_07280 [Hymenobacter jeollabukensis]